MKKKVVIKLGGSALDNPETLKELSQLIQGYRNAQRDVIVVHGGGPAINLELTRRDIQWKFINGQRQTTAAMMGVIDEVLGKTVNQVVVNSLREFGIPAARLSGADDKILFCSKASRELMRVGKVESVDTTSILNVLAEEIRPVPVIAPIGYGDKSKKYNVNADWAATKIAMALGAEELIFLTDQKGILDGNKNPITVATPEKIQGLIDSGIIYGGMCTKVLAMIMAVDAGVKKVRVLHATEAGRLLFTKRIGTLLKGRTYESASGF